MSFERDQRDYYLRGRFDLPPTNADSVVQLAMGLARPVTREVQSPAAIQRDQECRAGDLPTKRDPDARVGCGWWFSDDPAVPSTGAYGTRRGPMNPQVGSGEWIWNPQEAYQRESMKQAETIQSCEDLAFAKDPRIGWCVSSQRAVVTDGAGGPAFPRMAGGDCTGEIIMTAGACRRVAGTTNPNSVTELCTPADGRLSTGCLQSLVPLGGCSPDGRLGQALRNGYAGTSADFRDANKYLTERGFTMHSGIVNDGRLSVQEAVNSVKALRSTANPNDPSRMSQAAQSLCSGTAFDPCGFSSAELGPFPADCVRREAVRLGYRPEGEAIPRIIATYKGTWGNLQAEMQALKSKADNGSGPDQVQAIRDVYGLSVKFPRQACNVTGIMMYRYYMPIHSGTLANASGTHTAFLGRYILRDGFPNTGSTSMEQTPMGSFLTEAQTMVTDFTPTVGGSYVFMIACDDVVSLQIDGRLVANGVGCFGRGCGVPTPSEAITMVAGQRYRMVVSLWNGGGPWSFTIAASINGGQLQPIPKAQLFLPEDRRMPMLDLEFGVSRMQGDRIWDRNEIFQNLSVNYNAIGTLAGRKCWFAHPGRFLHNHAQYIQGIRARALQSITCMVNITRLVDTDNALIWSFFNTASSNTSAPPRIGNPPESLDPDFRTQELSLSFINDRVQLQFRDKAQPKIRSQYFAVAPPITWGTWTHIAIVWDEDWSGYAIYMNGVLAGQLRAPGPGVKLIFEHMLIGGFYKSWIGGLAWFRGFDYRLSESLIQRDRDNAWSSL